MELVMWEFKNLKLPMIDVGGQRLYTTNGVLTRGLGLSEAALRRVLNYDRGGLHPISVTNCNAKELLDQHREDFGIKRLRSDMLLWPERDCFKIALRSRSSVAYAFHDELFDFCKDHILRSYVPIDKYEAVLREFSCLREEFSEVKAAMAQFATNANESASLAGKVLQSQSAHKRFRVIQGGVAC